MEHVKNSFLHISASAISNPRIESRQKQASPDFGGFRELLVRRAFLTPTLASEEGGCGCIGVSRYERSLVSRHQRWKCEMLVLLNIDLIPCHVNTELEAARIGAHQANDTCERNR